MKYLSLSKIIKLLLTVILLGVLINILEYEKLINEYKKADLFYLFIATFSVPFIIGFRSLKWKILLQSYWDDITIVEAITSYLSGFAIGILTPARVGEFTRTIFLPNKDKVNVVNLVLLDRYCELVIMIFLILLSKNYDFFNSFVKKVQKLKKIPYMDILTSHFFYFF